MWTYVDEDNTVVSRYCNTAGIRKKYHITRLKSIILPDYRNIQYKFLMLCSSWDIDLVS